MDGNRKILREEEIQGTKEYKERTNTNSPTGSNVAVRVATL